MNRDVSGFHQVIQKKINLKDDPGKSTLLTSQVKDTPNSYRIIVEKNKKSGGSKTQELEVTDSYNHVMKIKRKLPDFSWLRDQFKLAFPYSYVSAWVLGLILRSQKVSD